MNNKRMLVTLCAGALAIGASFFGKGAQTSRPPSSQALPGQRGEAGEHKIYELLFRKAAFFGEKAAELERQGKDAREAYKFFHRQANLTETQGFAFDAISSSCLHEVAQQDEKAGKIISAF